MIYLVSYLSDGLKVKGYLGVPPGIKLPAAVLENWIGNFYVRNDLPVIEIANSIQSATCFDHFKKLPVLFYCRGGIGKVGRVKTNWIEDFVKQGYLVFAPCYRGNEGGEGRDEFGGADVEDVMAAVRLLASFPIVDPERMTVMGFSRGSINATQAVVQLKRINRLILWGGVADLAQTYEERMDLRRMLKRVIGGTPTKVPDAYRLRSPIFLAEQLKCPVLIVHGTDDVQVNFSHGQQMFNRLKEVGVEVHFHCYRGYGHHFPTPIHEAVVERMADWVDSNQKGAHEKLIEDGLAHHGHN